ncbi:tetratricopeptide repeat protein [Nitrogeniibacter mangrovi]|uniref:Tetratricopeptide repeat protein n=1 Tax=Nitrogeniibacter mangrovi TaxID=2016596 RepID=A0A6C1B8M6_9RHOO|nr:tetratricopeptide repeat protein [Nitrogeniibacter mangrovi]QID18604.1 tetratricopeptide repeat protein [Nitrogeniibacter mangrovi]
MHNIDDIKALFRAGRHAEALQACEQLCAAQPANTDLKRLCATMHGMTGRFDASARMLREVLEQAPDDMDALFNLAVCEREQRRFAEARTCYLRYTERLPKAWEGWLNLAECQVLLGEANAALTSVERAIQYNPKAAPAWMTKGDALAALGRHGEALKAYERANGLALSAGAFAKIGLTLSQLGRHPEALERLDQAVKMDPQLTAARAGRAKVLTQLGRAAQAVDDYTAILAVTPDDDETLKAASVCLAGLQRGEEAIALCDQALAANPDSLTAKLGKSWLIDKIVPNWHVPMMNEQARNNAYFEGMKTYVRPDTQVFEIGAGSGLLSMMAARLGARNVVTCEGAPLIARTAQQIVADNGFGDTVTVLAKPSFEVQLGSELPELADVLVHEIFSSGLIEEHVLPAMEDAKRRLLKPGAAIVPATASLMIALVGGEGFARYFHVKDPFGFDIRRFNAITPKKLPVFRADLHPELLSDDVEAFHFDFVNDDTYPAEQKVLEVSATAAGTCYGVIQWIRLNMDGTTVYENHPRDALPVSGWQHMFYRFDTPLELTPGQTLRLMAAHDRATPWFDLLAG